MAGIGGWILGMRGMMVTVLGEDSLTLAEANKSTESKEAIAKTTKVSFQSPKYVAEKPARIGPTKEEIALTN